jgi:hypothetical protein
MLPPPFRVPTKLLLPRQRPIAQTATRRRRSTCCAVDHRSGPITARQISGDSNSNSRVCRQVSTITNEPRHPLEEFYA